MSALICPGCAEFRTDDVGATCPTCGAVLVAPSEPSLEGLVRARLRRKIEAWREQHLIGPGMAARLITLLEASAESQPGRSPADPAPSVEQRADALAGSIRRAMSWRPGWGSALLRSLEETAKAEREAALQEASRARDDEDDGGERDLGLAMGSGSALFGQGGSGALGGGLDTLVSLDAPESAPSKEGALKLHEYVWWFLGALLVLGGSVMGVREAWRALGGVPRQLIVTGAFFAYHAGFIGLGAFLARRSLSAGRVLAGIGLALIPIVFVALAALVGLEPMVGLPCALVVAGLCLPTLRLSGRLLHGTSVVALAGALFPSLLAELPLMWLEADPWPRALCAFAGVGALGFSLWRSERAGKGLAPFVSVGLALYGALALAVFSVASGSDGFDALDPGSPVFAGMALWAVALAGTVAAAAMQDSVRQAYPRAAPVVELVAHAALACAVLAGGIAAFSSAPGLDSWVDLASAVTPAAVSLAFFLLEPRRRVLVHLAIPAAAASGFLLARLQVPDNAAWWCVGIAVVGSGLLLIARRIEQSGLRLRVLIWGVVLSSLSLPLVTGVLLVLDSWISWPKIVTGALVAVAAHLAAGHRWRGLHYLGGFALPFAVLPVLNAFPELSMSWATVAFFVLAGALHGLAGLAHGAWGRRRSLSLELSPLDDLSLVAVSLGVLPFLGAPDGGFPLRGPWAPTGAWTAWLIACAPPVVASVVLLLRVRRDRSRFVSFLAALGLALGVVRFVLLASASRSVDPLALVLASLVLGFALIASLRGRGAFPTVDNLRPAGPGRRLLLGDILPPFPESGRPLFTDGFAGAALALLFLGAWSLLFWLVAPSDATRPQALLAGGLLVASALVAFLTRGFVAWRLRGSMVALAAGGGLVAFTAVINRAGRPLPPDIVAWRLPLIGVALWGLALVARRFGPWLGRKLENEPHGRHYHWVPHAGVAALGLVLVKGAFGLGAVGLSRALGVVPPLSLLGPALLSVLLAASFRQRRLLNLGLLLGLSGAALWAAQQSLVGPGLTAMVPPSGQWVRTAALGTFASWLDPSAWLPPGATVLLLWQRAFMGIAAAGLAYAGAALVQAWFRARFAFLRRLLSWVSEEHREAFEYSLDSFAHALLADLRTWAGIAVALVTVSAFFLPVLSSAALVFATGAVLLLGRTRALGQGALGAGILLLVHAVAHRGSTFAVWPGPVLALVGLGVVLLGEWIAPRREGKEGRIRMRFRLSSSLYALAGTVYALAAGGAVDPSLAVPQLLYEAFSRLDGRWMLSVALPVTLALVAGTRVMGAFRWKGVLASVEAAWGSTLVGLACASGLSWGLVARAGEDWGPLGYQALLASFGAALALGAAGTAGVAHVASQWLRERRKDMSEGLGVGRDVWLIGCGGLLAAVAVLISNPGSELLPQALAALGLAVIVALHCAWSEHTGRHVYFVQVAVVGVYAMVRSLYATGLRPEHDALFALVLGFALVGVTVLARRAGIPPVANATRRFASLLPLLMWWVLPADATHEAALLAGGSGLLYAAIGAVEHSRWFGSLAAAACNLALLVAALAFGLEGLEIYLAPLGLLLMMLGQLFASSLPQAARNAARFLGGFLLYVPSAAKLSLQVGLAADGTYALVFGAACLIGVAVGMVLHIRAYLALGTLFLTLDVLANLVHAGLRDHRVGFVVMTLTGLTIVSGRVLATLKRQQLELWMRRVRVELRGWD